MSIFFNILTEDILPVFLIASLGASLVRIMKIDVALLTKIELTVFFPCLIFNSLVSKDVNINIVKQMALFGVLYYLLAILINSLIANVFRKNSDLRRTFIVSTAFSNVGDFGLPLLLFVYGQEAVAFATIVLIMNNLLLNTLGIWIVSSNPDNRMEAIRNVIKTPLVYAVLAGLVVLFTRITLPLPITRSVSLLGDAAIPIMLLLLGMRLKKVSWQQIKQVGLGVFAKLLLNPALALGLVILLGLTGTAAKVGVLLAGMPTPIIASIISTQYSKESSYAVNMCAVTTILSLFTLTTYIALLK
jgi:malate permease and related proteins